MSNAMRLGKRTLAGVAAGALALGMLSIAGAASVSAKPNVKPKATYTVTGTASPIRVSFNGTTLEGVPYSQISWTPGNSASMAGTETAIVALTTAPSPTAQIGVVGQSLRGNATVYSGGVFTNATDTAVLNQPTDVSTILVGSGTTGRIGIAANEAGTYAGTITVQPVSGDVNVVNFSFTTSGKPTSMTLTPASQTTAQLGAANLALTLKDAAGNTTQPLSVDTVTMTPASGASGSVTGVTATGNGTSSLFTGVAAATYTAPNTPGTFTVTATPGGTLPGSGVTAATATVTVSGSITETPVTAISMTVPSTAYANTTAVGYNALTNALWQVPALTKTMTIRVTGTVGATYRFSATASAGGTVDGVSTATLPVYKNVTIGADGRGTMTFEVGGNALAAGGTLSVRQVKADNSNVTASGGVLLVATQANPTIAADTIYLTPYGNVVAALGSTVKVTATVTDQFGTPVPGTIVNAYRTSSTTGALLSTGTTNASGAVELTVSGATGIASGTTENYVFQANYGGVQVNGAAPLGALSVQYTTSGAVTAMTVGVAGGAQTPILNTTTSILTRPYVQVPFGGVVNTAGTGVYTVATGAGTATGNYVTFTPSTTPANTVTVTVPEGVKVTDYDPSVYTVNWNSALASQSVTVTSGQAVYVFATKTGTHDVSFTSGAITTTAKIEVATVPAAAYNIAVSPTAQTIEAGAFKAVTLTVSDVFGNPIPGVTGVAGAAGTVAGSATGEVLLGGLNSSANFGTGASGTATVTLIAGKAGLGKVTFAPSGGATNAAAAWQTGYVKPVGAPDPVKSAEVNVVVTEAAARSIVISGDRATVSGKPGIKIDGVADGFEDGAKVKPWIRFPGETEYTVGSARPVVSDEGFTWQRKTGKKVYVYFTSEDDVIRSNRIVIAAN